MLFSPAGIGYNPPMKTCPRIIALAAAVALVGAASPSRSHCPKCEHKNHAIGIVGVYAAGFHHGETVHHGGVGAFYKTLVIPEWLLVEVAAKVMLSEHATHFPFELMLRKPIHVTDNLHLSPGIGPVFALNFHDDDTEFVFGIGGGVGIAYWLADWAGLKLELGYELHFEEELAHELVVAAGPVFGW